MAKRGRRSTSRRNTKVMSKSDEASVDRISLLPDEILVLILSLLTFKESIATSILSKRWNTLWTLVPKLDFFGMARNQESATHEERSRYIGWVEHVLTIHKSSVIEDFRVCFNMTRVHARHVDKWVKYALTRKVKRLEVNLTYKHNTFLPRPSSSCYTFPYKFIGQYKETISNQLNSIHFQYLEKISLAHVNVNGEALEFFLSNCPLLQHLSVSESKELLSLKIFGPFPSLKNLEIISCLKLNLFEIRDLNLVYLKYIGESIQQFRLQNVPQLVEIYIGGILEMENVLSMFSNILPQLEKFKLLIPGLLSFEATGRLYSAVRMTNLKQLVVTPYYAGSILPLTNIIRAAPCLETLIIETPHRSTRFGGSEIIKMEGSYSHLKEVIFRGYDRLNSELELITHLSECAVALEKIVIYLCKPPDDPCECFWRNIYKIKEMNTDQKRYARGVAKKQLARILPPRINLHIT